MLLIIKEVSYSHTHKYLSDFRTHLHADTDLKFLSDKKKFLFYPQQNYYHFLYDFLGQILFIKNNEKEDDIEFIIAFEDKHENKKNMMIFIKDFFEKINLKNYYIVEENKLFSINNYYYVGQQSEPSIAMHNIIYETLLKAYPSVLSNPEKMVYVSRRLSGQKRIDDCKKLENFFESLGFEIILRDQILDTDIVEEIKYFRDVKVIAGLSGAGLINSMFMQPGGTVIEIAVPQFTPIPRFEKVFPDIHLKARHLFTPPAAFIKNHNYIQIPVNDNSADNAINKLNSLGIFK
jgi:capsular polysaccharide biosynthesis protein